MRPNGLCFGNYKSSDRTRCERVERSRKRPTYWSSISRHCWVSCHVAPGMCNALKSSERATRRVEFLICSYISISGICYRMAGKADRKDQRQQCETRGHSDIVFSFDSNSCVYLDQARGSFRQRRRRVSRESATSGSASRRVPGPCRAKPRSKRRSKRSKRDSTSQKSLLSVFERGFLLDAIRDSPDSLSYRGRLRRM